MLATPSLSLLSLQLLGEPFEARRRGVDLRGRVLGADRGVLGALGGYLGTFGCGLVVAVAGPRGHREDHQ